MSRMKGELHPSKNRSGEAGEQRTTNSKARTHLLRIAPAPTVPPYADFFVFAVFFIVFQACSVAAGAIGGQRATAAPIEGRAPQGGRPAEERPCQGKR